MADKASSVLTRLKNKAKQTGKGFQLCLQLFCQEEFLRRVSMSKYADNLILKGGLLISILTNFESRATVDVDFLLRHKSNTQSDIEKMIIEVLSVPTGNDYVSFEINRFSPIAQHRKYNGISIQLIGRIKNTKTPFDVDFGVGDVIVPKPGKVFIPTQLEEFDRPEINTYSLESTIAEHNEMNLKWRHFLRKLKLKVAEPDFSEVLRLMDLFLGGIFNAIINETEFFGDWNKDKLEWS